MNARFFLNTLMFKFCYLEIIRFLHSHYHIKVYKKLGSLFESGYMINEAGNENQIIDTT